jgi:hypothetical protein
MAKVPSTVPPLRSHSQFYVMISKNKIHELVAKQQNQQHNNIGCIPKSCSEESFYSALRFTEMTDEEMDKFDEQRSLAMNTFSEVPYATPELVEPVAHILV